MFSILCGGAASVATRHRHRPSRRGRFGRFGTFDPVAALTRARADARIRARVCVRWGPKKTSQTSHNSRKCLDSGRFVVGRFAFGNVPKRPKTSKIRPIPPSNVPIPQVGGEGASDTRRTLVEHSSNTCRTLVIHLSYARAISSEQLTSRRKSQQCYRHRPDRTAAATAASAVVRCGSFWRRAPRSDGSHAARNRIGS